MRLLILAVGQRMPAWVNTGYLEYARRMPREMPLELKEIRPEARGSGGGPAQVERWLRAECERLRAACPTGCVSVALDERGRPHTTAELAHLVAGWRQEGTDVVFLIGGPDGLHENLKSPARLMLSLSAMTLPHQLVRVILAEQLYRAASILSGHPYHRS